MEEMDRVATPTDVDTTKAPVPMRSVTLWVRVAAVRQNLRWRGLGITGTGSLSDLATTTHPLTDPLTKKL